MDDEMEPRILVVTVGTSLFSSASWRVEEEWVKKVRGYPGWLADETFRSSPALRRTEGWRTADDIRRVFKDDRHALDEYFDWNPEDNPARYSGEINTLAKLYAREFGPGESFTQFLNRMYARIDLVCGSRTDDHSRWAAEALEAAIKHHLGYTRCQLRPLLLDQSVAPKLRHFADYLQRLSPERVDLLVTGGYKAFALLAGFLASDHPAGRWRLLYLHEDQQEELVVGDYDQQGRWRATPDAGEPVAVPRMQRPRDTPPE